MTDQETANRSRIARIYRYTGGYGTTEPSTAIDVEEATPVASESEPKTETEPAIEPEGEETMVFNRFKADSVAGRMLKALARGPKTAEQLAMQAKAKSAENVLAPGGWFYQLRKFGKTTGKFRLEKDGNKLVLTVNKRYVSQV
jgi:hypothetical protein